MAYDMHVYSVYTCTCIVCVCIGVVCVLEGDGGPYLTFVLQGDGLDEPEPFSVSLLCTFG